MKNKNKNGMFEQIDIKNSNKFDMIMSKNKLKYALESR